MSDGPTLPAPRTASRAAGPGAALRTLGIAQVATLAGVGLARAGGETAGRVGDLFVGPARRAERRRARRVRHLERVARALGRLKGVFAKAGQFAALRYDVLPPEVRAGLAALRDRVPPLPLEAVRPVVEQELGGRLEDLFARFDAEAFAAASIAQVHYAELPGGEPVAVKVQYPWLERSLPADLALARRLVRLWTRGRSGSVDARRLFEEFAAGLREELDFRREAAVAEEIAANLADDPAIVVPRVHPERSSRRVLTLDHHRGLPLSRPETLRRAGVDPAEVLRIVARAYARQVFVDGLFHADPHPGNLFVLDAPDAGRRPRVVFVDFGLSKRLAPELRAAMRRGVHALLRRDAEAFAAEMDAAGMIAPGAREDARRSVEAMFARLAEEGSPLGLSGGRVLGLKDEAKALLSSTPGLQLPNELLLWTRTLTYLVALGQELAPGEDVVRLALPYLLRFLAAPDAAPGASAAPAAAPRGG